MEPLEPTFDQASPPVRSSGDATAGLVCGIISIFMAGTCVVGFVLGWLGIRLSRPPEGGPRVGNAQAAFICSVIGLALSSISGVIWTIYLLVFGLIFGTFLGVAKESAEVAEQRQAREAALAKLAEEAVADGRIRFTESGVERTGDEADGQVVFAGEVENGSGEAIERIDVEIRFAGDPPPRMLTYEIYVAPGARRRLLPREILPRPPAGEGGSEPRIARVGLVYRPE